MTNREIDIEVAEKVMGWKQVGGDWCDIKGIFTGYSYSGITQEFPRLFVPAEIIQDAWLVVEKMRERELKLLIETFLDGYVEASFVKLNRMEVGRGWDKSASKAICLAALKAVEVE